MNNPLRGNTGSLRRQLVGQLVVGFALLGLVLYWIVLASARDIANPSQDNLLGASALAIAESLSYRNGKLHIDIPYSAFAALGSSSQDRVFYAVYDPQGSLLTGYEGLQSALVPAVESRPAFETVIFKQAEVRLAVLRQSLLGGNMQDTVTIMVGQTREGLEQLTNNFALMAALIVGGFFVLSAALSFYAVSSGLAPIRRISDSLKSRKSSDFSMVSENLPTEIKPMVQSLNAFINRLQKNHETAEKLILDAAHQIRTPLSALSAQTEVVLNTARTEAMQERLRRILKSARQANRVANQILNHAMVTYRDVREKFTEVRLHDLCASVVRDFDNTMAVQRTDIIIDCDENLVLTEDKISLSEAIRNLLDNALKYGLKESDIQLTCRRETNNRVAIAVTNQGPQLSPGELQQFRQPFERGQHLDHIVGSGLGLVIVERVARQHRGTLVLEPGSVSGLRATLNLAGDREE
jgi:two-component system sensor histidine kinase TctE